MSEFLIRDYIAPNGRCPYVEWLSDLRDIKTQTRIRVRIKRLSLGNFGDVKALGSGLYELRLFFGPGYRVYFGRDGETIILILCGGDKSSQSRDIEKARTYWAEYLGRDV